MARILTNYTLRRKHTHSWNLFVCLFVQSTSPQRRRMPSIPYGLQDTSLFHCFGIFRVDKTSTGFSVESGYPSIESSSLITRQGKLCNNCLMLSHASVCSHYGKSSCRRLLSAHVYSRLTTTVTASAARQYGRKSCYWSTVKLLSYWSFCITPLILWI